MRRNRHVLRGQGELEAVTTLYQRWDQDVTRGRHDACGHGLEEEPYFKYFSYKPFVTPYAGLVQIRRVAEETAQTALLEQFDTLNRLRGEVLEEIHRLLVEEFWYFQ